MGSKKELLRNSKLYLILDAQVNSADELVEIARLSAQAGVDIMQLRDKDSSAKDTFYLAKEIIKVIKNKSLFIINDRIDVALACGADGVHLGQDDLPLKEARRIAKSKILIGQSAQSLDHLKNAQKQGADYIGFGSVFKTQTKPGRQPMDLNLLRKAARSKCPLFAIGGIDLNNISSVLNVGIKRVAVCRAICKAQNKEEAVKKFLRALRG